MTLLLTFNVGLYFSIDHVVGQYICYDICFLVFTIICFISFLLLQINWLCGAALGVKYTQNATFLIHYSVLYLQIDVQTIYQWTWRYNNKPGGSWRRKSYFKCSWLIKKTLRKAGVAVTLPFNQGSWVQGRGAMLNTLWEASTWSSPCILRAEERIIHRGLLLLLLHQDRTSGIVSRTDTSV